MGEIMTEERRQIRDTVRRFVDRELVPLEAVLIDREMAGGLTSPGLTVEERRQLQVKGKDLGFWGIDTPEEYGGANLDPVTLAVIHIELGRTFVDFEFGGSVLPALYSCAGTQKERYLLPTLKGQKTSCIAISEPGGGSDAKGMRTIARRTDSGWVINGEKMWITRGDTADYAILFARTPSDHDPTAITCFLVDRERGWTSSPIHMMGSRDKIASLHFNDVFVPDDAVLGEVNKGFAHAMPFIYRNRAYVLSAKNIGAMQRLLQMAVEWADQRVIFGKKLRDRENIAFAIAEMEIELRAAALLVFHGAEKAMQGGDYRHEACVTKVHVARAANRIVDTVLQIHGAMGYAKESPIERWYRDLRVERIYDGSDEVNLAAIARNLFKGFVSPGDIY